MQSPYNPYRGDNRGLYREYIQEYIQEWYYVGIIVSYDLLITSKVGICVGRSLCSALSLNVRPTHISMLAGVEPQQYHPAHGASGYL